MVVDYKSQLVEYLRKNISKGYTLESLKIALLKQGYSRAIIDRAIKELNKELSKKVPEFREKPRIKYEIIDENNQPIRIRKPFWKRIFNR